MKDEQGTSTGGRRTRGRSSAMMGGSPVPATSGRTYMHSPGRASGTVAARPAVLRVLIRPARPDDLEEATLVERQVWGRLGASLNELQRRLFALPEAFLLAELQRPAQSPRIVGLTSVFQQHLASLALAKRQRRTTPAATCCTSSLWVSNRDCGAEASDCVSSRKRSRSDADGT